MDMAKSKIAQWISGLLTDTPAQEIMAMLEYPKEESLGDLSLPCFKLSKKLRKSPMQIATELKEALDVITSYSIHYTKLYEPIRGDRPQPVGDGWASRTCDLCSYWRRRQRWRSSTWCRQPCSYAGERYIFCDLAKRSSFDLVEGCLQGG